MDHATFNDFIYTDPKKVQSILEERKNNTELIKKVLDFLNEDIPEPLKDQQRAVLFRQLSTPNYETLRFLTITDGLDLKNLFWEYTEDKFTSNNEYKKSLGKLMFFEGEGKKGGQKIKRSTVIDFNSFNGKKISEVKTLNGMSLLDFHHLLMEKKAPIKPNYFDASQWLSLHGKTSEEYYDNFLALFITHGVLFENFLMDGSEGDFTFNVFLPAFKRIYEKFGVKPLIVALEPTEVEGSEFWYCHPIETLSFINSIDLLN
ncbi:MAG: hypothetical protein WCO58_01010 [bacterium]